MKKELVCITCPIGCHLEVEIEGLEVISVSGNTCPRGDAYARKELVHPTRMLTSTVKIKNARYCRLPVITSSDIPKEKLFEVMEALKKVEVSAPIKVKDIVIKNVCEQNVDIVASRSMDEYFHD